MCKPELTPVALDSWLTEGADSVNEDSAAAAAAAAAAADDND